MLKAAASSTGGGFYPVSSCCSISPPAAHTAFLLPSKSKIAPFARPHQVTSSSSLSCLCHLPSHPTTATGGKRMHPINEIPFSPAASASPEEVYTFLSPQDGVTCRRLHFRESY